MILQEKHHKHPPLMRPKIGHYHRCEWGIYGTTCGNIEAFYQAISAHLEAQFRLLFVDAEHGEKRKAAKRQIGVKQFSLEAGSTWNEYDDKLERFACDAVFVNGNHYPANRQIVFLDPKKRDSLFRRVEQLTNIHILIKENPEQEIFDFIEKKITSETKVFTKEDFFSIYEILTKSIQATTPPLKALILAGGKSQRMGKDKSQLMYHGQPQELFMAQLCRDLGLEVYISKATDFQETEVAGTPVLKDRLVQMGPFGAILSAMMHEPDTAWLVVACDLPFLNASTLEQLIRKRHTGKFATAIKSKSKAFPEPLIAIYEPRAYLRFLSFLSLGYACPRKVLINSEVELVALENDKILKNVNTPAERKAVLEELKINKGY